MYILRPQYITKLYKLITNPSIKLIFLHGGRGTGKTTLLKHIQTDTHFSQKTYYFSFEEDVVAKRFKSSTEFKNYMQMRQRIDFTQDTILLLNEIQYSKNFLHVLYELLQDPELKTTIIATGIFQTEESDYQQLYASGAVQTITVYPLGLFDILKYKGFQIDYLKLTNPSRIVFEELQGLFDEFLTRGGYPDVVLSTTRKEKGQILRAIIQKVYDKDVGFNFHGIDSLSFQDILEQLCFMPMEGLKITRLANRLDISTTLLKKYISFFIDNRLITKLDYFRSDKTRELSHQNTITINDTGILSYMTHSFGSKLHHLPTIRNFIYNEITKQLPDNDVCMTYEKTNNSRIDFIIQHSDDTITPIVVSDTDTTSLPKVFKGFHKLYGDRIRQYIKTTSLTVHHGSHEGVKFLCVPHFMVGEGIQ